jgi:cytochrome c peroxidase
VKLARVVSVFEPAAFMYRKQQCGCINAPTFVEDVNSNVLKIFKNQVAYSTKMGQNLYYEIKTSDGKETVCSYCHTKYAVLYTKYASCQRIEVLALSSDDHAESNAGVDTQWKKLQPL